MLQGRPTISLLPQTGQTRSFLPRRMKELVLLLLGTQVLCCWSLPAAGQETPFRSLACSDSAATIAADMALRQINADRREGYVFSLYRIANVQENFQGSSGHVYYLTLDVLETVCHVLSRRAFESCERKPLHQAVYGQCKAVMHINRPRRIVHLHSYDCTLRPVPRSSIQMMCPDCPVSTSLDNPKYLETAQLSLDKFNRESNLTKHFSLLNITSGSMQWVVGASYFVEFTIQETNCANGQSVDSSKCQLLDCEFAHIGHCKGSLMIPHMAPEEQSLSASCEIFEPEAAVTEEQKHKEGEEKHDHRKNKGAGHSHDHKDDHHHKDDHAHNHSHAHDHDHQHLHPHEHHHPTPVARGPQDKFRTVGVVRVLSSVDEPSAPGSAGKPVTLPSFPDRPVGSEGGRPATLPFFPPKQDRAGKGRPPVDLPFPEPVDLPFPEISSESSLCPGEAKNDVPLINSLLSKDHQAPPPASV